MDPSSDGGGTDAGADASTVTVCAAHDHCDDGDFCNGPELCEPGSPQADARGCVAGEAPCMASQSCDEDLNRCLSDCDSEPDADDDGHRSFNCGGGDCDDADSTAFPGAAEVCDAEGHDEDCDPDTLAGESETDVDEDGYVSIACCNRQSSGAIRCGLDCNDDASAASPARPEVCDELDNDCDAMIDERVRTTYYADADGDLFGDMTMPMEACVQPADHVANADDCDDAVSTVNPSASETCNAADDDCDAAVDEGATPGPGSCGACGMVCPAGWSCREGTCVDPVVEVATGRDTVCARLSTGRVFCWGFGWTNWTAPYPPTEVAGVGGATSLSVGGYTGCAALSDGDVKCWGEDPITGTYDMTATSVGVPGTATSVSVGGSHMCALNAADEVHCWGENMYGQLGDGSTAASAAPVRVPGLAADEITAGYKSTCARSGTSVYCWGANDLRQLGNGSTSGPSTTPVLTNVADVATLGGGGNTFCASSGTDLLCWGDNSAEQAGQYGSFGEAIEPSLVNGYPWVTTTQIASAYVTYRPLGGGRVNSGYTCSVAATGRVYCWGSLPYSQTARQLAGIDMITSLDAGEFGRPFAGQTSSVGPFLCASDTAGSLWCWGYNEYNFLRTGDTGPVPMPALVMGLPPTTAPIPR